MGVVVAVRFLGSIVEPFPYLKLLCLAAEHYIIAQRRWLQLRR